MLRKKIAIIGAGITGLSLAYFLQKKGCQVTIFEKENCLGGLASTFKFEKTYLEKFYHHFFLQDKDILELIQELGLSDRLIWRKAPMAFYVDRFYPFSSAFDLLRFSPLMFFDRIRLGGLVMKSFNIKDWEKLEKISARQWLQKEIGQKAFQVVWEPLLKSKFGRHADEIPASWVWARLKARGTSRSKLGFLNGGLKILFDALYSSILRMGGKVYLDSEVTAFPCPGYDYTVATMAPPLVGPRYSHMKYLGNIGVVFKIKKAFSRYYWTNIADRNLPFCAVVEHTNAFDDPAYLGKKILYVSNYLDHQDALWQQTDEEVAQHYLSGLKKINPAIEVEDYHVFRERYAQPLITMGYLKQKLAFETGNKAFYLVNNAQIYPKDRGMSDSIALVKKFISLCV